MTAISQDNHSKLSQELRAAHPADEPILLTAKKRKETTPMRMGAARPAPAPKKQDPVFVDRAPQAEVAAERRPVIAQQHSPQAAFSPLVPDERPVMLKPKRAPAPAPAPAPASQAVAPSNDLPQRSGGQRHPLKIEVDYQSEHHFYTGFLENISAGGLFIATHVPGSVGDELEITFTVPGLPDPCVAQCRVRWIREATTSTMDMPPGMGCQFSGLDPDAAAAIQLFLKHREPIFYDD